MAKIQIGYNEHLGQGAPTIVEAHEGVLIKIEGLTGLVLSVEGGVLTVHGDGSAIPIIRPISANEVRIKPGGLFGEDRF